MDLEITRFSAHTQCRVKDVVAEEEPLEIWVKATLKDNKGQVRASQQRVSVTMRTPGDDINLVRGWQHSTALVPWESIQTIAHTGSAHLKGETTNQVLVTLKPGVNLDTEILARTDYSHGSCGICGQHSIEHLLTRLPPPELNAAHWLTAQHVYQVVQQLNSFQSQFRLTGGVHGAGLFDQTQGLLSVCEDVGRHNALDKLIGRYLTDFPADVGILLSGRVSFELVQKVAMAGLRYIVALGAPTSLAVELCKERDITLIGFASTQQFNLYHGRLDTSYPRKAQHELETY